MKAKIICALLAATLMTGLFACKNKGDNAYEHKEDNDYLNCIELSDYVTELDENETEIFMKQGLTNRQGVHTRGIAVSSYYTAEVNGESAPVYMVLTAETTPHSVLFLDIGEDELKKGLDIKLKAEFDLDAAVILPEKLGVGVNVEGNTLGFRVDKYGSYTVIVGDTTRPERSFTLFCRAPEKVEVPYGYTLVEYKPGLHFVDNIVLKSNTVLYLHAGALLVAKTPSFVGGTAPRGFIVAENAQNVKIVGHGIIDLSKIPWSVMRGIFINLSSHVEVNGVTIVNPATWSMHFNYIDDLTVEDCIIFGCRQNSDGYAVCSCTNATVRNSFARSGDDLFEVKTYAGGKSENVLFENCVAWPDNCRGYGIIQETASDISHVTYRNCSLLYQLNDWSEKMAAFVVTAGEEGNVSDLLFDNCDLYYSSVYAIRFSVGANDETSGPTNFNNRITGVTFKDCTFKNPASDRGIIKFRNATENADGISGIVFENTTFRGKKAESITDLDPDYEGLKTTDVTFR